MAEFQPEPKNQIRCFVCDKEIGYMDSSSLMISSVYCPSCGEEEWQKNLAIHERRIKADRKVIGDEAYVKLWYPDASCQKGIGETGKGRYYILSFARSHRWSSGYHETPEATWKAEADRIEAKGECPTICVHVCAITCRAPSLTTTIRTATAAGIVTRPRSRRREATDDRPL